MTTPLSTPLLLLCLLASSVVLSQVPTVEAKHVRIFANTTYANGAWGFNGNEKMGADYEHRQMLLMDVDDVSWTSRIPELKAKNHIIHCYFSVGTNEKFRADYKANKTAWNAISLKPLPTFPDEFWLDLRHMDVMKSLVTPRFLKAKELGCDAIEPDNTDCYDNAECWKSMKGVTKAQVKAMDYAYLLWLADLAHSLGMAITLKNTLALIPELVDVFDGAVNEQCMQYKECGVYKPFIARDKAVFSHAYALKDGKCARAKAMNIRMLKCKGSEAEGVCFQRSNWVMCDSGTPIPLPPVTYV